MINRIVTYSLLAQINNSQIGLTDFSDIFVPLVKRVISKMNEEGHNKGEDIGEIKTKVDSLFNLDMPYPLLKKIVKRIAKEANKKGEIQFEVYDDGAFIIKDFVFSDYEEIINKQEKEVSDIEDLYHQFLQINNVKVESQPSIFDYIDKNRGSLSQYLANRPSQQTQLDFTFPAKFIVSFRDSATVYPIIRKIYLGSIISSYLEFKTEGKYIEDGVEFVLDTNFIIGLLDLNNIESTHTCKKIVEMCKAFGYRVSVLDYTVEETHDLLERTADRFEGVFLARSINPESIYNACERRRLSATDLQRIYSSLDQIILNDLGLFVVRDTIKFRNQAKYSEEYERFKIIRVNEWSALHDATAVKYVQYKRGKKVKEFQDAKCWFVTNPHHESKFAINGDFLPDIISAEDLVNILWLTNPNVKAKMNVADLSEIGLSRLISSTLSSSLPSARIVKELDENIQKYAKDVIPDREIIRVAKRIANKTNAALEEINKTAARDPGEFVRRLQEEANKAEREQTLFNKKLKDLILKMKQQVEGRALEREQTMLKEHKEREEILRSDLERSMSEQMRAKDIETRETLLLRLKSNFQPVERTKKAYDKSAGDRAQLYLAVIVLTPLAIVTAIDLWLDWNFFNSKSILPTALLYTMQYAFFVWRGKEWSLKDMWNVLKRNQIERYYRRFSFDIEEYDRLLKEIQELESEIASQGEFLSLK
jgi:hypothetical protein